MPIVDFTLADMRKQTEEIVEKALIKEREHTKGLFKTERAHTDGLFKAERIRTDGQFESQRSYMDERFDEVLLATAQVVTTVTEHMDERFDRLEGEMKDVKRLV